MRLAAITPRTWFLPSFMILGSENAWIEANKKMVFKADFWSQKFFTIT
jgi:hypothetical protein